MFGFRHAARLLSWVAFPLARAENGTRRTLRVKEKEAED
jgi:hypothetical protein